jgi:alkylhydroperoxidase family enzyme
MANLPYPDRRDMPDDLLGLLESMPRHAPVEMLAHSPKLASAFLRTAQVQFTDLELSLRHRELLILTVASAVECDYEYQQHVSISEDAGVVPALRESIWRKEVDETLLDEADRALVALVEAVVDSPTVSARRLSEVREHLSVRQVVEVIQLVGFYWGLGRLCTVLDLEIDAEDGVASVRAVASLNGAG